MPRESIGGRSFRFRFDGHFPFLVVAACVAAQIFLGPAGDIATTTANWFSGEQTRARKRAFISQIPPEASVLAPLPYLSHLAMREKLYSLHYVLKGLKTLEPLDLFTSATDGFRSDRLRRFRHF